MAHHISEFAVPEVVVASDAVRAHYLSGRSSTLVVTFGGVGRDPSTAPEVEFLGSASGRGENHVLAINDLKRTWYSQPLVLDDIQLAFDRIIAKVKPERIVSIGNSMGAYGAILFTKQFGFDTTLAIAPQFSMNDDIVKERRWSEYRGNFGPLLAESLREAIATTQNSMVILHGLMGPDLRHIDRFKLRRGMHHGLVRRESHGVGLVLKQRAALSSFIGRTIVGDIDGVKQALSEFEVYWRDPSVIDDQAQVHALRNADLAEKIAVRDLRLQRRARRTNV